jgi:purine-binding chemotaxis protein CheW
MPSTPEEARMSVMTALGQSSVETDVGNGSSDPQVGESLQFVTCRVEGEEFAIDILSVQEIIRMVDLTRVPKTAPYVEGVINLRGRIVPVINLRRRFGMPDVPKTIHSRIIIVYVRKRAVGLLVDAVSEVMRVAKGQIEPAPSIGSALGAEFVQGVGRIGERLMTILDLNRLLVSSALPGGGDS